MTMHLQKFVDRVRGHEARGARDFVMTMSEAKDLHADITRLLLTLQTLQEQATKTNTDEVMQVEIVGGQF
jgi:adenosylcobinamide amidohydrolase